MNNKAHRKLVRDIKFRYGLTLTETLALFESVAEAIQQIPDNNKMNKEQKIRGILHDALGIEALGNDAKYAEMCIDEASPALTSLLSQELAKRDEAKDKE